MPPGTPVSLHGVIVTAVDTFGAKTGNLWVEDADGGEYSGILIFKADTSVVATLMPGDVVDVTGASKDEFALPADTSGRTDTELQPATMGTTVSITKTGTGTVPAPIVVDALMIGQMADPARSMEWEKYEGVLVTINNVSALSAPKGFGSTMPYPGDSYNFGITGDIKVESSLADVLSLNIKRNDCLGSVTGVMDYFFDYLVLPRSSSEITTGGTGCPPPESTMALCTDGLDNDANGFGDCLDNNCIIAYGPGPGTCRVASTIAALDQAVDANAATPVLPMGGLDIGNAAESVCVSAVAMNGQNMWVSNSATGGADSGAYVFNGGQALPAGVTAGTKVGIIGSASAFKPTTAPAGAIPLLEVGSLQITKLSGACTVAPSVQTVANLTTEATGRKMVGSLVKIAALSKVTVAETQANHFTGSVISGGVTFNILGDIHQDTDAVNACYSVLTGIWTWDVYNQKWAIELNAAPTAGTGCP